MFLLASLATGAAQALEIDGRLTSSSFFSESFGDDQEMQWDLVNRVTFNARELGHRTVSLHWLGAHRGEALVDGLDSSQVRTYQGYLRFHPRADIQMAVGRQWVYGGVGSGRMDGLRLQLSKSRLGRLMLFAGTRGFLGPDGDSFEGFDLDAFDESGIWGGYLRTGELPGRLTLGASAARLFRGNAEEAERLGLSIGWRPLAHTSLDYEHRYDIGQEVSYYQHLQLGYRPGPGFMNLAWNRREGFPPAIDQSYIARYFRDQAWFTSSFSQSQLTDEIRAHVSWPLPVMKQGWDLRLDVLEVFPDGEDRGDGLRFGLARPGYALGYRLERGFGGDQDGLYGSARYEVRERTWIWLDLNKIYYRFGEVEDLDDEIVVDDESLATRLGIDALVGGDFDVRAAVEILRNPRAEHEVRFLARIGYRFQQSWHGEEN